VAAAESVKHALRTQTALSHIRLAMKEFASVLSRFVLKASKWLRHVTPTMECALMLVAQVTPIATPICVMTTYRFVLLVL
jgi:hypothetical protein